MKRVCTYCERISPDGNLWCQDPQCPVGNMPLIFGYGEWLGDIEVVRLLRVLRASAIYEAQRSGTMVLLKVAHPGYEDQLRLEAKTLVTLAQKEQHPMLPVLLPAYRQADIGQRPYGKTVFRNETKYYEVFEHSKGEFLRDLLLKNPQPWYQHAAWLTIGMADVLAFMHIRAQKLHLNLNPDLIYVRHDKEGIPRPLLLDLGLMSDLAHVDPAWVRKYALPAYTPPELFSTNGSTIGYPGDVYGLGLLLYEMLAGHPAYSFKQRQDETVRSDVIKTLVSPLNRTDLAPDIHEIVSLAISKSPIQRQQDVRVFAKMLRTKFGEVPAEKKRAPFERRLAILIVVAVLAVVLLIMLSALVG